MAKKIEKLLADAEKAYRKRDRRKVARSVDEILKRDFTHQETWAFLHRIYGGDQPFDEFQRTFVEKYYPDKVHLLVAEGQKPAGSAYAAAVRDELGIKAKKPSFFARIFRRSSRTAMEDEPMSESAALEQESQPQISEARTVAGMTIPEPSRPAQPDVSRKPPRQRPAPGAAAVEVRQPAARESLQTRQRTSLLLKTAGGRTKPSISEPTPLSAPTSGPKPLSSGISRHSGKIRVAVVDDIAQTRENIIRTLRFHDEFEVIGTARNGVQAIELAKETEPDVIVMDVNMPDMDGITATKNIRREVPGTQIVILTVQDDVDYIRQAMMAGARDFLGKPPTIDELVQTVKRAYDYGKEERARAEMGDRVPLPGELGMTGSIITVFSPRGGVGCSMLAANLASALYNEDTPVIIVDANLQFGDVPVMFNIQGRNTILDLTARAAELDRELIEEVVITHASGVQLIAPTRPEDAEIVKASQFSTLLEYLKRTYAYVIVDTAHSLSDITISAFDLSDIVLLVATQDIPSIARMRRFLDLAPLLGIGKDRMLVVMNKFNPRIEITPAKIGKTFGREIAAVIPLSEELVIPSINRGLPFMLRKEVLTQPIARSMLDLIEAIRAQITKLEQAQAAEEEEEKVV